MAESVTCLNMGNVFQILRNNADGSEKGSLLWRMDHTQTAFGARLLRHWVCFQVSTWCLLSLLFAKDIL
jgi:hypothetical protein